MKERTRSRRDWIRHLISTLVGTAILATGIFFAYRWITHKPRAHKRYNAAPSAPLVETIRPKPVDVPAVLDTYAKVIPYRTQTLSSRVNSQIVFLSPRLIPGQVVKKGETLIRLDATDYRLALKERESAVANARLTLETEQEKSQSAAFELAMAEQNLSMKQKSFLLRHPHIAAAEASLSAAEAAYEKAKIDLARCRIKAPFHALVLSVDVAVGDTVNSAKMLATLCRTNRFWVRASLSQKALKGIDIPGYNAEKGSHVTIRNEAWPPSAPDIDGVVEALEKRVDNKTQTAYLLIRVEDPLALRHNHRPLMLDTFVRIKIIGKTLHNVLVIPSSALRSDDTIWILRPDRTLHIQKVPILWRETDRFMIDAALLKPDESVILTVIETPVEGMKLRVAPSKFHAVAMKSDRKAGYNAPPHRLRGD